MSNQNKLSIDEAFSRIAIVVNNDIKAAAFLTMGAGSPVDHVNVRDDLDDKLANHPGLVPNVYTVRGYLHTLHTASKVLDHSDGGYTVNDFGVRYAQPIVAELMRFSNANGKFMFELLGSTNSKKPDLRANSARIKLLEALRDGRKKTLAELTRGIERAHSRVNGHLDALDKSGFLRYETAHIHGREGETIYEPSPQLLMTSNWILPTLPAVQYKLAKHILSVGDSTAFEAHEEIKEHDVDTLRAVLNKMAHRKLVQKIRWTERYIRSEAAISDLGRKYLDKWTELRAVYFCDGQGMEELREQFREVSENPTKFRELVVLGIERYKKNGPRAGQFTN